MGFSRLVQGAALGLFCSLCLPAAIPAQALFVAALAHAGAGVRMPGQGYLGIDIRDVTDGEVSTLRLKNSHGAEVIMVDHDGPAGKAGLREHDVVLNVNGVGIDGEDQLRRLLRDMQPGRLVSINICRAGQEQTVTATMANRAELEKQAWDQHWTVPEPPPTNGGAPAPAVKSSFGHGFMSGHLLPMMTTYTGATVDILGTQLADYFGVKDGKGLLVHDVEENSPAAAAGLHAGDVVTRVNGEKVATRSDWTRALHDSKGYPVSLVIVRDHHEQQLTMVPDAKRRSAVDASPAQDERGWLSVLLLR